MFRVNLKVATVKTRKKNLKRNWHGICEPTIIFHVLGKIFVEIGTVSAAKIVKGYEDNFGAAELPILPPPPPPQLLANKLSADSRSTAVSTCFFFFFCLVEAVYIARERFDSRGRRRRGWGGSGTVLTALGDCQPPPFQGVLRAIEVGVINPKRFSTIASDTYCTMLFANPIDLYICRALACNTLSCPVCCLSRANERVFSSFDGALSKSL